MSDGVVRLAPPPEKSARAQAAELLVRKLVEFMQERGIETINAQGFFPNGDAFFFNTDQTPAEALILLEAHKRWVKGVCDQLFDMRRPV